MNEICETWSSRWRALQRDLASGLGPDNAAHPTDTITAVKLQSAAVAASSWLGRARLRATAAYVRQ
jgi:hypothetical protein